jgi:hypothetical protein
MATDASQRGIIVAVRTHIGIRGCTRRPEKPLYIVEFLKPSEADSHLISERKRTTLVAESV